MAATSPHKMPDTRAKLVLALDKPSPREAERLVEELGDLVLIYKIGLELVLSQGGLDFAKGLQRRGKLVFLDMKILDIPNTVEKAIANVARQGFDFVTVHGIDRKTLDAAIRGRDQDARPPGSRLKLLSVTVLTSSTAHELGEQGVKESPLELAVRRARLAGSAGFDGVIASGHEVQPIRQTTLDRPDFIVMVPGIRPASSSSGDQSRVMTPTQAVQAGATHLVIGRPIADAESPARAARTICDEIAAAMS